MRQNHKEEILDYYSLDELDYNDDFFEDEWFWRRLWIIFSLLLETDNLDRVLFY